MGIFSTYSQGENRVTSTILAVLEELHQKLVALILQRLTGGNTLPFLEYINQPRKKDPKSIPDGHIKGLFSYYIETKLKKDAYKDGSNQDQFKNHLKGYVEKMPEGVHSALIVITPDDFKPNFISEFIEKYEAKNRCYWANFDRLINVIDEILLNLLNEEDILQYILTNREAYLLNELKKFIKECPEDLLPYDYTKYEHTNRVIVIANNDEYYPIYEKVGCCIWQPGRPFTKSAHMAFYSQNKICEVVPRILGYIDSVDVPNKNFDENKIVIFGEEINKGKFIERLDEICDFLAKNGYSQTYKIIILSKKDDERTIKLKQGEIKNDLTSSSGRRIAFTLGQPRYVDLDALKKCRTTSKLIKQTNRH